MGGQGLMGSVATGTANAPQPTYGQPTGLPSGLSNAFSQGMFTATPSSTSAIPSNGSDVGLGQAMATTDTGQSPSLASLGSIQTPVNQDSYKQYVDMQNMFGMEAGGPTMSYEDWAANTTAINNRNASPEYQKFLANTPAGLGGMILNNNPQTPNNFVNAAPQGVGQTTPTQNPYGTNPYQSSTNPFIQAAQQTQFGNVQGAQAATAANRVNQTTPFGSLTYTQTGVDANGNPVWSANQSFAPEVAGTMSNISNQISRNIGQGFNPNLPSTGINPGEIYSDAILRRLQPTQERAQKALDAQLANQGIMPGSEAYNQAKTLQAQQQNDQLTSAIVGGMQTGLQANQQGYNQALQSYNLPLSQLAAYRSATAPTFVNPYTQAAVSGPDYLGAYTTQANADLAAQNAKAAQQAGLTSGLFSLGGTALSNPAVTGAISSGLGTVGNAVSDWWNGLSF